jgi:hypothetical protein
MESVKFPEMTGTYAKSQPQYKTLHLHEMETEEKGVKQYTAKYELNDFEIAQIVKTRSFFGIQIGSCLHPSSSVTHNPFFAIPVHFSKSENGMITAWMPDSNGNEHKFTSGSATGIIDTIINYFSDISSPDQLYFIERSAAVVGPEGLEGL